MEELVPITSIEEATSSSPWARLCVAEPVLHRPCSARINPNFTEFAAAIIVHRASQPPFVLQQPPRGRHSLQQQEECCAFSEVLVDMLTGCQSRHWTSGQPDPNLQSSSSTVDDVPVQAMSRAPVGPPLSKQDNSLHTVYTPFIKASFHDSTFKGGTTPAAPDNRLISTAECENPSAATIHQPHSNNEIAISKIYTHHSVHSLPSWRSTSTSPPSMENHWPINKMDYRAIHENMAKMDTVFDRPLSDADFIDGSLQRDHGGVDDLLYGNFMSAKKALFFKNQAESAAFAERYD